MASEIRVVQNTDAWKEARKGPLRISIGGSGIGAAAGLNQHMSRSEYFSLQLHDTQVEQTEAMKHGHRFEALNAQLYVEWTGNKVSECGVHVPDPANNPLFQEGDDLYFCASLDRVGKEVDLECKCPVSLNSFNQYYCDRIDYSYLAQVHLQMAIRRRKRIHFMVTLYDKDSGQLVKALLYEIDFSLDFWNFIYRRAREVAEALFLNLYSTETESIADIDTDIKDIPEVTYRLLRSIK